MSGFIGIKLFCCVKIEHCVGITNPKFGKVAFDLICRMGKLMTGSEYEVYLMNKNDCLAQC